MTTVVPHPPERSVQRMPGEPFDVAVAFDAHGSELLGFAVNALRDLPAAEDCVQETFLRAWRARAQFDADRGSVRTWLFAIERRVILDVLRSRRRSPRLVPDDGAGEIAAPAADPLDRLGIVEAIATLSPKHRDAVVAVHLRGLGYDEAAGAARVPVATMRTRVFYALRALRAHLDRTEPNDD